MSGLAAALVLWLSHDAVAQGDLARLEPFAERVQLEVSPGARSNLVSDSAARALAGWPAVVGVELRPPLTPQEAVQLRKIPRLHAILVGADAGKTLTLLGPALVRTSSALAAEQELERPCAQVRVVRLSGGATRFEVTGRVDDCAVAALAALAARAEATVPQVGAAQGGTRSARLDPAFVPEPLAAEPGGPAATVLVEVEGEGAGAGRFRELVAQRLVGRTLTGVALPFDGVSATRVLARAQLVPLAALGKEVARPQCADVGAQALWRLVVAAERAAKGAGRVTARLSYLRCVSWERFAEAEAASKGAEAAPGEAVNLAEALLAKGADGAR